MFQNLFIDRLSFWIGFFSGVLFVWFLGRLRSTLPKLVRFIKDRIRRARENMEAGTEIRFRRDVLRYVQKQHLASSLFSLDEVLIQPFLQTPPTQAHLFNETTFQDAPNQHMPYLPDWPEFRASFSGPTLTLADALQKGANLLLLGHPGSGKTTILSHLAGLMAQNRAEPGFLSDMVPLPIHAADLGLHEYDGADPYLPLQEAISTYAAPLTMTRIANFIKPALQTGKCLVLVDGIDELPPTEIERVKEFLSQLLQNYPHVRVAAAASPDYYDGLSTLELLPVSMAVWNSQQMAAFIHQWGGLWQQHVQGESQGPDRIDSFLLESWLSGGDCFTTPLEKTLSIWAAYAGDVLGPEPAHAIEAHLRRLTARDPLSRPALEKIASSAAREMKTAFTLKEAERWLQESLLLDDILSAASAASEEDREHEEQEAAESPAANGHKDQKTGTKTALQESLPSHRVLSGAINSGLLVERKNGRFSFSHPVFAGYLAGAGLAKEGGIDQLLEQPQWSGKLLALQFLSAFSDISAQALPLLDQAGDPVRRRATSSWRWLRYSKKETRWRSSALRKLASVVQDPTCLTGVRLRAITALASTRDPGVCLLFRQLLKHNNPDIRQAGALGCGLINDAKSLPELSVLIDDLSPEVGRSAILALSAIGTTPALEEIKNALYTGSDDIRKAAAEALSSHEEAGHPVLEEGSKIEDMLVRKAVVYGLAKVGEPWARQILEAMQIEDGQWLVRNAANQALEELSQTALHIPQPMPVLTDAPWLLVFAGKLGIGVSPGKPAFELVLQALKKGEPEEQLAALEYLKIHPNEDAAPAIYEILYGCEGELEEAAFETLWSMTSAGIPLPSPVQYGLGD
jgi:HEAT repeat protein/energy-coupling factor transporter ATP-binding protein EcfA2